jgi:hypothetical protein
VVYGQPLVSVCAAVWRLTVRRARSPGFTSARASSRVSHSASLRGFPATGVVRTIDPRVPRRPSPPTTGLPRSTRTLPGYKYTSLRPRSAFPEPPGSPTEFSRATVGNLFLARTTIVLLTIPNLSTSQYPHVQSPPRRQCPFTPGAAATRESGPPASLNFKLFSPLRTEPR